jgi:hypothetical protein
MPRILLNTFGSLGAATTNVTFREEIKACNIDPWIFAHLTLSSAALGNIVEEMPPHPTGGPSSCPVWQGVRGSNLLRSTFVIKSILLKRASCTREWPSK